MLGHQQPPVRSWDTEMGFSRLRRDPSRGKPFLRPPAKLPTLRTTGTMSLGGSSGAPSMRREREGRQPVLAGAFLEGLPLRPRRAPCSLPGLPSPSPRSSPAGFLRHRDRGSEKDQRRPCHVPIAVSSSLFF